MRRPPSRIDPTRHALEALECRHLLSAAVINQVLVIEGDDHNNHYVIEAGPEPGEVRIAGSGHGDRGLYTQVNRIEVDLGDGDDGLEIRGAVLDGRGRIMGAVVRGGDGDDVLRGGAGRDRLFGQGGDDDIAGGGGNDQLRGDDGVDTLDYSEAVDGVVVNLGRRKAGAGAGDRDRVFGFEVVYGSAFADTLGGSRKQDILIGGAGDDVINGRNGSDQLEGGDGDDRITDNRGDNTIFGGAGADIIVTGAGGDLIHGGAGSDVIRDRGGDNDIDGGDALDIINDRVELDINLPHVAQNPPTEARPLSQRVISFMPIGNSSTRDAVRRVGWNLPSAGWKGFVNKIIRPQLDWGVRRIQLHNPFGTLTGEAMQADQYLEAQAAGLNWLTRGFVEAWSPVIAGAFTKGEPVEVIAYFGSFKLDSDFVRLHNEGRVTEWYSRAIESLRPALEAGMSIGMDALTSLKANHPAYKLADQLLGDGVPVYVETWPGRRSAHWRKFGIIAHERLIDSVKSHGRQYLKRKQILGELVRLENRADQLRADPVRYVQTRLRRGQDSVSVPVRILVGEMTLEALLP